MTDTIAANYRIVKYKDNSGFGLHEVYHDDAGNVIGMTQEPASFCCDNDEGPTGVLESLIMAKRDAGERPVFAEPDSWPEPMRDAASEINNLRKALHIVEDDRQQAAEEIDRLRKKNNDLVRTYVAK